MPLLPLSPITAEGSQDAIMVQVGSSTDEMVTPAGLCQTRSTHRRRPRRPLKRELIQEKPAPAEDFLFKNILRAPGVPRNTTETDGNKDRKRIPRWRLSREGPFLHERSLASLRVLGTGCAFWQTTYRAEDHAPPGGLGVPLNHPRLLEWVGAPASAWLLEMSPGKWLDSLSRDQAMTVAMQLHKDACLMNTNLDILDQYALSLSLHGTASKILEKTIGCSPYPTAAVAAGAQGPRARRASVQMEALPGSSIAGNNVLAEHKHEWFTRTIMTIMTLCSYYLNVILDCSVGLASRAVVFFGRFSSMWRFPLF